MPSAQLTCLREAIRDEGLRETIGFLWQKAEPFHARQTAPGASDSGQKHCSLVERNIFRILSGAGRLEQFHDGEIFLLSAAACCHDFDKGLPDQAKGELAQKLGFGPDPADLRHGPLGGRFIVDAHEALGLTREQAELVDLAVRHHNEIGEALCATLERLHEVKRSLFDQLDIPALVTLLKLADALQYHGRLRTVDVVAALDSLKQDPSSADAQLQARLAVFRDRANDWFLDGTTCLLSVSPRSLDEVADCRSCFEWLRDNEFTPLVSELRRLHLPWKLELDVNEDYLEALPTSPKGHTSVLPGLYSYGPADADILCGRDEDIDAVLGLVEYHRFSAVIGPSGVGKSSLIAAGIIPVFEDLGRPWVLTRPDPAAGAPFRPSDFAEALGRPVGDEDLARLCAELQEKAGGKLSLVVIDQFEDVAYHGLFAPDSVFSVINEARFKAPQVRFLFSYRDDAHGRLLPICKLLAGSPAGLPAHGVRPLSQTDATKALAALLTRAAVCVSADLLERAAENLRQASQGEGGPDAIYPPFIQMIAALMVDLAEDGAMAEKVYETAISMGNDEDPGTAIVGHYLDTVLEDLRKRHGLDPEREGNPILIALSRTTGERAQASVAEVASSAGLPHDRVAQVLPWLREARLVRELADGRWEIAHDFLARYIAEGRMSPEQRRARAFVETLRHRARSYAQVRELLTANELIELFLQRNALREHLSECERGLVLYSGWGAWGPFWWASPCDSRSLLEIALDAANDTYSGIRAAAARILGALGTLDNLELLARLGDDDDEDVFEAAHSAIRTLLADCEPELITEFVVHDSAIVRSLSAEAMGVRGDPEGLAALELLTADKHRIVRSSAAQAIGALGNPAGLDALMTLASDSNRDLRSAVAGAIGTLGCPEGLDALKALAEDEDVDVRQAAAEAIGTLGCPEGLDALKALAEDEDVDVRQAAAEAIGVLRSPEGIEALKALAGDEDSHVREAAAEAVGVLGSLQGLDALRELAGDNEWEVRLASAKALGAVGAPQGLDALKALARDEDSHVRRAAAEALRRITVPESLNVLAALARDEAWHVRVAATETLRRMGAPQDLNVLAALARDEAWHVRMAAAETLRRMGAPQDLEVLKVLTQDEDPHIRVAAAGALAAVRAPEGLGALTALARDKNQWVRLSAAGALGALGAPQGLEALRVLAGDEEWCVRQAAVEAIASLGVMEGLDALRKLTADEDSNVREAAARAIRSILEREGPEAAERFLDLYEREVGIEALFQLDWLLYCPEPLREAFDPEQRMRSPF